MLVHGIVGDGWECLIGTVGAFDARFLAYTRCPLVVAGGAVARASGLRFPPDRIDILASPKQRSEESDFLGGRRVVTDRNISDRRYCATSRRQGSVANLSPLDEGTQLVILGPKLCAFGLE